MIILIYFFIYFKLYIEDKDGMMKIRRKDFIVKKEKKKYSIKQILLILLGITWMISSLVACFVVYQIKPIYCIIIFGQYFLIFGLLLVYAKNILGWFLSLVGFLLIAGTILVLTPGIDRITFTKDFIMDLTLALVLFFLGIGFIFGPKLIWGEKLGYGKKVKVDGKVVNLKKAKREDGSIVRLAIYEYEWQGKIYTYQSQDVMDDKELSGKEKKIKILVKKPNIVIENGLLLNWALPTLGICFIIGGIVTLMGIFITTGK